MAPRHEPVKTFILAQSFDFLPGGSISLGNIFIDPFEVDRPVSKPDSDSVPLPPVVHVTEYDRHVKAESGRTLGLELWAKFLESVGVNIGTDNESTHTVDYTIDILETSYFEPPSDADIAKRILSDPDLRTLMRVDSIWSKPVYMITGIKVAKGLRVNTGQTSRHGGKLGYSAPISQDLAVQAGAEASVSMNETRTDSYRLGNDIVFAYQLLKIMPKGWKEKWLNVERYRKGAFLGDKIPEEIDENFELESVLGTEAELGETDDDGNDDTELRVFELNGDTEMWKCVARK